VVRKKQLGNAYHGHPHLLDGHPHLVDGRPHLVDGRPRLVDGRPRLVDGHPRLVDGRPRIVDGHTRGDEGKTVGARGKTAVHSPISQAHTQLLGGSPIAYNQNGPISSSLAFSNVMPIFSATLIEAACCSSIRQTKRVRPNCPKA
jgi:hypothetical protein